MRSPFLGLLLALSVLMQNAASLYTGPRCPELLNKYGKWLASSLFIEHYPMCCNHEDFFDEGICHTIRCYHSWFNGKNPQKVCLAGLNDLTPAPVQISTGCNPTEHVILKLDRTTPPTPTHTASSFSSQTCFSLVNQIRSRWYWMGTKVIYRYLQALQKCGPGLKLMMKEYLPKCCNHPVSGIAAQVQKYPRLEKACRSAQYSYGRRRRSEESQTIGNESHMDKHLKVPSHEIFFS